MKIGGTHYRSIWAEGGPGGVSIIDQTRLPWELVIRPLTSLEDAAEAIEVMRVRGAPLIGVTAAFGLALALARNPSDAALEAATARLVRTRPTAVNLRWALDEIAAAVRNQPHAARAEIAFARAGVLADEDVETCRRIGDHGLPLIRQAAEEKAAARKTGPVNILTHCNAGWIATVDWGTALAPIYRAHDEGLAVHVWVDETRPRNQGALLTAWELGAHGVPHTVIVDNAGGHLMQRGDVDMCLVGTDRTTAAGDVANKIGTYLKALAARDNGVPFYVALPHTSIDWTLDDGFEIAIEERAIHEVTRVSGQIAGEKMASVAVSAPGSAAANPSFDITPARLVTALITERGVTEASRNGLLKLYPERAS